MSKVTDADHKAAKVRAFLAAIAVLPSITRAAKAAGCSRDLHYAHYKVDAAYTAAFDKAWELGVDSIQDGTIERMDEGVPEPVFYRGSLVMEPVLDQDGRPVLEPDVDELGNERVNDAGEPKMRPMMRPLLIRKFSVDREKLILSAMRPDRYRQRVEHSGEIAVNLAERLAAGRKRVANERP